MKKHWGIGIVVLCTAGLGAASPASAQGPLDRLESGIRNSNGQTVTAVAAPQRVYLGAFADNEAGRGVRVLSVRSGGPAERAGLQTQDLIIGAAGRKIHLLEELSTILNALNPGDHLSLDLLRGNKTLRIDVVLGAPPAPPSQANRARRQAFTAQEKQKPFRRHLARRRPHCRPKDQQSLYPIRSRLSRTARRRRSKNFAVGSISWSAGSKNWNMPWPRSGSNARCRFGEGLPTPPELPTPGFPRARRPSVGGVARSETGHKSAGSARVSRPRRNFRPQVFPAPGDLRSAAWLGQRPATRAQVRRGSPDPAGTSDRRLSPAPGDLRSAAWLGQRPATRAQVRRGSPDPAETSDPRFSPRRETFGRRRGSVRDRPQERV